MINEIRNKYFKNSSVHIPASYFLSWIIVNYILYGIIGSKYGLLNHIVTFFGGKSINFTTNPNTGQSFLSSWRCGRIWEWTWLFIWRQLPDLTRSYDAAAVDGASRWQMCRRITIPMLMPTVIMPKESCYRKGFYGDFGMIYALVGDNGVLYHKTDVIDTYVFRTLRTTGNPSQAMAISLFQAIMGFICVWGSNYIAKKKFKEGALFWWRIKISWESADLSCTTLTAAFCVLPLLLILIVSFTKESLS